MKKKKEKVTGKRNIVLPLGIIAVVIIGIFLGALYRRRLQKILHYQEPATRLGVLNITSQPEGAKIYLDGKKLERLTPTRLDSLSFGRHRIELRKAGYKPYIKHFVIKKDEIITINALLIRKIIKLSYRDTRGKPMPHRIAAFMSNYAAAT